MKRKIKKWPFFVFIPIGLLFTLFIVWGGGILFSITNSERVAKRELPLLLDDFSSWTSNGFTAVYDHESQLINYPNGYLSKSIRDLSGNNSLIAVSRNETMFLKRNRNSHSSSIIVTDWEFNYKRTILTLDGDLYSTELIDGRIAVGDSDKTILFDVVTGESNTISKSFRSFDNYGINLLSGIFRLKNGNYYADVPHYKEVSFTENAIDEDIVKLLDKWDFYPARCRLMLDGTICCSFHRELGFGGGQSAVFMLNIDESGAILSYQLSQINSSYQYSNWAYDIHESFADNIIISY